MFLPSLLWIYLIHASIFHPSLHSFSTSVPQPLLKLMKERKYNKHATPTQGTGPTKVMISMYIEGLSSFKAQTMDFHVDIYFQEYWTDERLSHNETSQILIRDMGIYEELWHPDLYFANARRSSFHDVTAPNLLVWVNQSGGVYFDSRVSLTVMCMMDLKKYPLDSQNCNIRILSCFVKDAYDEDQLDLAWAPGDSIDQNHLIKLPDMYVEGTEKGICNGSYAAGVWSCITIEFRVRREIMHHVLQSYIPTALIVFISWFSFWLDVDAVPGRISLCITTLLTLATQASAARLALPEVSYIKAIDVWMGTCLAFVFGVMIEFTMVNYWARRKGPLLHRKPSSIASGRRSRLPSLFGHGDPENKAEKLTRERPLHLGPVPRSDLENSKYLLSPCFQATPLGIIEANGGIPRDKSEVWKRRGNGVEEEEETSLIRRGNIDDPTHFNFRYRGASNKTRQHTHFYENPVSPEKPASGLSGLRSAINAKLKDGKEDLVPNGGKQESPTKRSPLKSWLDSVNKAKALRRNQSRKSAQSVDQMSRWLFPLAFAIFNVCYWIYYIYFA